MVIADDYLSVINDYQLGPPSPIRGRKPESTYENHAQKGMNSTWFHVENHLGSAPFTVII
jgi:hypothetical protein